MILITFFFYTIIFLHENQPAKIFHKEQNDSKLTANACTIFY